MVQDMHLQIAEVAAEGDLLRLVDALRWKHQQQVSIERVLDRLHPRCA